MLGLLTRLLIKKRKLAVERNLRIAFGESKSDEELLSMSKEVFRRTGGNLLSAIKTATMPIGSIQKHLTIECSEEIRAFLDRNDGGILLLPHMGNWEMITKLAQIVYQDIDPGSMYRPLNNPYIDKLLKNRRENAGTHLFARDDGMAATLQFIRNKGLLSILADQRVGKAGQLTHFFGRLTSFSPLPHIYKKRTQCGIMGLAVITTAPGKWTIRHTFEVEKDTDINTGDVAQIMQRLMEQSPEDCFWLQDRWRLEKKPLKLLGKEPIIQPMLSSPDFKPQHSGIYIEQVSEEQKSALQALATHRPDFKLICFSPSSINLENIECVVTSRITQTSEFSSYITEQHKNLDILFIPKGNEEVTLPNTLVYPLDYNDLMKSLHIAGLPEKKIS